LQSERASVIKVLIRFETSVFGGIQMRKDGRKGRKKLVGAVLLGASVVGTTMTLPEKVAIGAGVEVQLGPNGIPLLGQGNKTADDHRDDKAIHDY
jgi:hypothetical protein